MTEPLLHRFIMSSDDFVSSFQQFMTQRRAHTGKDVAASVSDILQAVKTRGDEALLEYTGRFDRLDIQCDALAITAQEVDTAYRHCAPDVIEALELAVKRITDYHTRQLPKDWAYSDEHGTMLGMRWSAIDVAGIYVPGGKASYPSSVLMNALPARAAGVRDMVMCVPTPDGELNPAILVAARLCGIEKIYRVGGAQAIAAMGYGTQTIPAVNVIAGPGNAYVQEAKRQLFGYVGIDMVAGPSEIAIIADGSVDPAWLAADMLSQAEHDELAQSILITHDADYAAQVEQSILQTLEQLPRKAIALQSLQQFGAIILCDDMAQSCEAANLVAAEHLELAVEDTDFCLAHIRHAGAIFIGRYTPEAIGDYIAGPSHVLPTTQSAAYASGLSVYHFMKKTSLIQCSKDGFASLADATALLAQCEGLDAHKLSVTIRQESE